MRKHLIVLFSLLTPLGIVGCSDDKNEPPVIEPEAVTLAVSTENVYGEELAVSWSEGDQLGVFAAETVNGTFLLSGQGGTAAGNFGGEITGTPQTYAVYYPYAATTVMEEKVLSVKVPEIQHYTAGKLTKGENPMVGVSASTTVKMKNLCGVLGVKVVAEKNVTVYSITFKAAEGQKVAGDAAVDISGGAEDPVLVMSGTAANSVKLNVSDEGFIIAKGNSAMFYIVLPPQTYTGVEISIHTGDNEDKVFQVEGGLTINRSAMTKGVEFVFEKDGEPKPEDGTDLNDPNRYNISGLTEVYSNCYLIGQSGAYFFNATVIGNGEDGIHPDGGFHTESVSISPLSAVLLWEEEEGTVTDVKLSEGGTYLLFNAVKIPGNAVIAVYDGANGSGNILWSWHIWLSETPRDHQYKDSDGNNTYLVMDRNLGAKYAPATDVQADIEAMTTAQRFASYGLYYQWGRKDPFWGGATVTGMKEKTVFGQVTAFNTIAYDGTQDNVNNNLLYAVQHPATYILWNKTNLVWTVNPVPNLWGNPTGYDNYPKGKKTIYDPCPVGYMVSPADLWLASKFDEAYIGKFSKGRMFKYDGNNIAWYPGAGLRWEDDGGLGDVGIAGYYWSNSVFDAEGKGAAEYLFPLSSTGIFTLNKYASASGHNVRCVRE